MLIIKCEKTREKRVRKEKKKKIFRVLITQNPAAVFRRSPEFAPSDRHDFWTEASLHIKEGFDRWDLDFEAWKFCFLPGQIASCLVIFFLSCSLFVAIYLDIDSKIMMIVLASMGIKFEDEIQGLWLLDEEESHKVPLHIQMSWSQKGRGEVKVEARQDSKKENKKKNYNNQKNKHKKDDDGDDNTEVNTTTDEFFVCSDYDMVNLAHDDSSWILDSGATCYVATRKRIIFHLITPGESSGWLPQQFMVKACGSDSRIIDLLQAGKESKLYMDNIRKQTRRAFKSRPSFRTENILICTFDICGSMKGLRHLFHALVERQTGKKLKYIQSDNRGEYIGPFDAYCREHGIQHQKTPPKTPQLNGLAERMNRTLVERVRCLLSHAGLPASFWGEALNTAVHVINLTPCVPLRFDVPDRVWSGKDVSYHHLRVFDVRHWIFPKMKRSKLDVRIKPCVFHGYSSVPPKTFYAQFGDDIQKDEEQNDEEHGADDVDAQEQPNLDEDVHPELPYVLLTDGGEPECYAEAMEDEHKKEWFDAMQDEMKSLYENNTFELTKLPKGKRALKNKWVYKLKTEEYTPRPRYKARLVVKGFSQKKGIDFDEIFSPVVKMGSIRVVLGLAASLDLEVEQMDVKTAFLHGDLDKEIYMEQPEGFQVKGKEDYVCRLQKSLYGLKQAPRQWYKKFESVIGKQGFRKTFSDHCVFFQRFGDDDFIILLLYVDDMLIVGKNIGRIAQLKQDLSKSFAMKDLGPAKQILGIRIFRDRGAKKLHISQEQYIEKVLRRFNMDKAKVVSSPLTPNFKLTDKDCPSSKKNIEKMDRVPYASAVGSLMYAMVCTRPDLAHAVGVVSRFLSNPGKKHWEAVKWIFRYLRGTSKLGITFGNGKPMLVGYTDSDLAGNKDNMKSTSGYLMTFAGGAVSWQSRLQKCVALSTTEAEYVAATEACKELLWLKRFLQELGFKQQRYAVLCDNQSTIHLAKNSMFHKRTKHIDIRYHWIRDAIEDGMFELNKVHTDDNASDMLTKAVAREKLKICCSFAGMANSSS
ncbi:putative RNA-directed DNA polymerase [Tanacetum coccineum]